MKYLSTLLSVIAVAFSCMSVEALSANHFDDTTASPVKFVIIHDDDETDCTSAWYPWLQVELQSRGYSVFLPEMPLDQRASSWLSVMDADLCDENTVIIAHGVGAQVAMCYAQTHKLLGLVLVAPSVNDSSSRDCVAAWDLQKISENVQWTLQFSSTNDSLVPYDQAELVSEMLWVVLESRHSFFACQNMGHLGKEFKTANFILEGSLLRECINPSTQARTIEYGVREILASNRRYIPVHVKKITK